MNHPVIVFDKLFNLTCSNNSGSYTIFNTKGKYYILSHEWLGEKGMVNWEPHPFSKDSVFAELQLYSIDTRKSRLLADSVSFYNQYEFSYPILGQLENKIVRGKKSDLYPQFTSYRKNIKIDQIFTDVNYKGGYKLKGTKFIADGGSSGMAEIIFRKNAKDVFIANANTFYIDSDKIVSKGAGIKIFLDKDSIYHNNLEFKYFDNKKQLTLFRDLNGVSSAPMINTYHNVTMDFEFLQWNIETDLITFGSLPGSAESSVEFESVDRYLDSKFHEIGGIDAVHPLILIRNYVEFNKEETFLVKDFARFTGFPLLQIQHYLIRLAKEGFIFYDFDLERITVLDKLYNYISAYSGKGDYDVISFKSKISHGQYDTSDKHLVNSALNLETKDLNIIGIHNIEVSKKRAVFLYPSNGIVVIKKNRDFVFNGQILAGKGRLNLFGRKFFFHYDDFKLDLNYIDSIRLSVPIKPIQKDMYDNEILTNVRTLIEAVKGDLRIDHPTNKSGMRKDSFPEFPIFRSFEDSYAYYDKNTIYQGVYDRNKFSFHLQPFEIDSLDNYTGKGLAFPGSFESADIFPIFQDTLRLQEDYSLGFHRLTPVNGFDIYRGKGKYYNDIYLSDQGLIGSGNIEYLTSKSHSNEILFFPDSANFYTQSFVISEVSTGIEFPDVNNTYSYAHFQPYDDRLNIYKTEDDFSFYQSQASFDGDLLMRTTGLTGRGTMSLDKAEVTSNLFSYNVDWFACDTASLEVFEEQGDLAFRANDLKTHIDLDMREGYFYSNGADSYVELPANQYIAYIDKLRWSMDNRSLKLGDESSVGEGSDFVSIHPEQDSLGFFAKTASYSLSEYVIHAAGVEEIAVADAIIYPDSGIVTVAKNAVIETLYEANILADNLTEYHKFTNAAVNLISAHDYMASGDYTYKDAMNNEQKIFFKEIRVNDDTITVAVGDVSNDKIFHIDSKFDFKGSVDLIADQRNLIFDGYFMANHNCSVLDREWVKFRSEIDPQNISFIIGDKIFNDNKELLSTGLISSIDSGNFYSTFLNKKKNPSLDLNILSASYSLMYNNHDSSYVVSGIDTLSNKYVLYDQTCDFLGEGIIELDINLGQIKVQSIGKTTHNMKSREIKLEGFFMLDFFFSEEALQVMADDFYAAPGEDFFEYDNDFSKNLSRVVGSKKGESLLLDLEMKDEYSKFPDEMKKSIVFAKTKFTWDNKNKAYVSKGAIAISNIMDKQVNSILNGYLIIEKGQKTDILTIYLETELMEEYYFQYKNGVMRAWSTNLNFMEAINETDVDDRIAEKPRKGSAYRYDFASEELVENFLKKVKKRY